MSPPHPLFWWEEGDPQSCREPLTGTPGSGHARRAPGWLENHRSAVGKTPSVPLPRASGTRAAEGAGVRCEESSRLEDPPWPTRQHPPGSRHCTPPDPHPRHRQRMSPPPHLPITGLKPRKGGLEEVRESETRSALLWGTVTKDQDPLHEGYPGLSTRQRAVGAGQCWSPETRGCE